MMHNPESSPKVPRLYLAVSSHLVLMNMQKKINICLMTLTNAAPCMVIMSGAVLWLQQAGGGSS